MYQFEVFGSWIQVNVMLVFKSWYIMCELELVHFDVLFFRIFSFCSINSFTLVASPLTVIFLFLIEIVLFLHSWFHVFFFFVVLHCHFCLNVSFISSIVLIVFGRILFIHSIYPIQHIDFRVFFHSTFFSLLCNHECYLILVYYSMLKYPS